MPSAIAELKCVVKAEVRMLESYLITRIGKSLDLPFSSLLIICSTSYSVQSEKKIRFGVGVGINCL